MALARDTHRDYKVMTVESIAEYNLPTSATVYEGSALSFVSTAGVEDGTVDVLTSGERFAGFAIEGASTADGDARVKCQRRGEFKIAVTGVDGVNDIGKAVYATDDGTFTLTIGGSYIGRVTAHVSGTTCYVGYDVFAAPPLNPPVSQTVVIDGSDAVTRDVLASENGTTFTTLAGSDSIVTFNLPAATLGLRYTFYVGAAVALVVNPTDTNTVTGTTGTAGAAGKNISADAAGEFIEIQCFVAGAWVVTNSRGTWTVET